MPYYTYQCTKCEHIFDELQDLSDELLTDCPECGEEGVLNKILYASQVNFRLKGSGCYNKPKS